MFFVNIYGFSRKNEQFSQFFDFFFGFAGFFLIFFTIFAQKSHFYRNCIFWLKKAQFFQFLRKICNFPEKMCTFKRFLQNSHENREFSNFSCKNPNFSRIFAKFSVFRLQKCHFFNFSLIFAKLVIFSSKLTFFAPKADI